MAGPWCHRFPLQFACDKVIMGTVAKVLKEHLQCEFNKDSVL